MLHAEMLAHAAEAFPDEACGLVVAYGKHHRLIRAKNLASAPRLTFDLDPEAWLEVADSEEVIGVYHSHPSGIAEPSLADLTSCSLSSMPWHIIGYQTGDYRRIEPDGFRAPYLQRPYVYGVHDCWSLVRDWYMWEKGAEVADFNRIDRWWEKGMNLFVERIEACGFTHLKDEAPLPGDAFLIQVNSDVPNHIAVWLGDGTILHHVQGRLSAREPWAGYWVKHCTHHLRHNSTMGNTANG
jgi:proteasome lid subunit RPN8/RPN11